MNKIRTGDEVIVIAGKDKAKRGKVISRTDDSHLVVEGVNLAKKHTKPNPMKNVTGGIVDKTMPIHQSNVAIFNAATGKADRVGVKTLTDGTRVRIYKSSGEEIQSVAPSKKTA
jgi:large subunit ribosomal protein L24